jgi:hypothetical protein
LCVRVLSGLHALWGFGGWKTTVSH